MLNNLLKLIIYTLNIPLYWISYYIPKSSNTWVFGAWFGNQYTDNSKHLFEYVNRNHKKIRPIWLSKSNKVLEYIHSLGYEAYSTYSFKGYYFGILAKYVILSTAISDVNRYVCVSPSSTVLQLWHGTPLKKIHFDDKNNKSLNPIGVNRIVKLLTDFVFPFKDRKYDYTISSSDIVSDCLKSAFRIKMKNILPSGYPRNDVLYSKKNTEKIILYLPTFRNNSNYDLFHNLNVFKMTAFLKDHDINFYYKLHYVDKSTLNEKNVNIKQLHDIDIYELLAITDILITDYSSVYFDFLLTGRPIIFTPFDLDDYIRKERELYFNYHEVTPGPKCRDWNEVLLELEKIISGKDDYKKERQIVNNRFNTFQDGNSSKRVVEFIQQQII